MMVALTELTIKEVWTLSRLEAVKKGKEAWAGLSILCWDSSRMEIKNVQKQIKMWPCLTEVPLLSTRAWEKGGP